MSVHPELASEQAYIDAAYDCLDGMRASARQLQYSVESGAGGTHQARYERDVTYERALERLSRLELGRESLVFGRTDHENGDRFYIGRLAVSDRDQNPVVIDGRAPVAAAFYRATGRNPMGLARRRHFATEGRVLLGLDDEVFSVELLEHDEGMGLVGSGALLAALGRSRSGHMRDIVATIQTEQDEIIRGPLPGVLVVQGGPGTGKTAVALHRAAYLLYTHRFPLERQGVLVVGPNRLFMRYISRVLPALGETGVELAAIDELYPEVVVSGRDTPEAARVKGDTRMAKVVRRAVATRQRGLRDDLVVGFGLAQLRVTAAETADLVQAVKRMHRLHNAGRRHLQHLLAQRLYDRYRDAMRRLGRGTEGEGMALHDFEASVRRDEAFRLALDRMWPLLTPQMLLRDLYGALPLVRAAARGVLTDAELETLLRPRGEHVDDVRWTSADVPLLDEAATLLGPLERKPSGAHNAHGHGNGHTAGHANGAYRPNPDGGPAPLSSEEAHRTYGHIVVDEAQDLSPMQLRMLGRRSLSGSMTVVGDIGQATGMFAPHSWDEVLAHLPNRRPAHQVELTVGYRTPTEIMDLAARVLEVAAPDLKPPVSVRSSGLAPRFVGAAPGEAIGPVAARGVEYVSRIAGDGTIGVICPEALVDEVTAALEAGGVAVDAAGALETVAVLPIGSVKGLEFDGVVVVEPARIVRDSPQGLRSLYVSLTRATRVLAVAHAEALPESLSAGD